MSNCQAIFVIFLIKLKILTRSMAVHDYQGISGISVTLSDNSGETYIEQD